MTGLSGHKAQSQYLLVFFLATSLIFYIPLYGAGFVTDFLGWLNCYDDHSLLEAHKCFGVKGLYYIPFAILYVMTSLFGTHALPWYILFAGLHGLNAYMIFKVSRRLGAFFEFQIPVSVAATGAILFLVFPYNVEVVAWKACSNYLSAMLLMLLSLEMYLKKHLSGNKKAYAASLALFALSLFNIEFALLLPLILVIVHFCSDQFRWRQIKFTIPYFVLVALVLLINQVVIERSVGHYEITSSALNPSLLAASEIKYVIKNLLFFRFTPFEWQQDVYAFIDKPAFAWISLAVLLTVAGITLYRVRRQNPRKQFVSSMIGTYFLMILPVAPLYFYFILLSENDRYSYMALAFLLPALTVWLWNKGRIGKVVLGVYLILAATLATRMNLHWKHSTQLHDHLVATFPETNEATYILNVPDNYRGTFMFRNIGAESAFEEALDRFGSASHDRIIDVLQYNVALIDDGVSVSRISSDTLKVEFNQWGNWWWRNGVGASNYSTEEYRVRPQGKYYKFVDKALPDSYNLIYYDGTAWQYYKD